MEMENDYFDTTERNILIKKERSISFDDLPPFFVIVSVIGVVTNGALVYILSKTNARHTPNVFVLSLAAADTLVLLCFLPFVAQASPSYPFGEALCKITETLYVVANGATPFTLVALGEHSFLDRPATTPTLAIGNVRCNIVALIWTLAILLAAPTMLFATLFHGHDGEMEIVLCVPTVHSMKKFEILFRFVAYVVIPLIAVGYLYAIARRNRSANVHGPVQRDSTNLMIVLIVVYAICHVPGYLSDISVIFHYDHGTYSDLRHAVHVLCYALSLAYRSLNPVAVCCASGVYRQLFKRHLMCWCVTEHREPVETNREPVPYDELATRNGVLESST